MSTCISRQGEFSDHTPDTDYVCTRCGALDEDGLIAELRQSRATRYSALAEVAALKNGRAWEANRANEAARLSAEARDRADDLTRQIEQLREQLSIVESDRTSRDAWAVRLGIRYDLSDELDPYEAIDRHIRKVIAQIEEALGMGDGPMERALMALDVATARLKRAERVVEAAIALVDAWAFGRVAHGGGLRKVVEAYRAAHSTSERCRSCKHEMVLHYAEGCRFTTVHGTSGRDLVCPCSVPSTSEETW